jgi:hypothetical protein
MATLSQFSFHARNILGSMIGASEVQPTGTDGYLYYDVTMHETDTATPLVGGAGASANLIGYVGGQGSGKKVGVVAYDYVMARWGIWFTSGVNLVGNEGQYLNDVGAIKDFIASLPTPQTIDEAGDQITYPASFVGTVG